MGLPQFNASATLIKQMFVKEVAATALSNLVQRATLLRCSQPPTRSSAQTTTEQRATQTQQNLTAAWSGGSSAAGGARR